MTAAALRKLIRNSATQPFVVTMKDGAACRIERKRFCFLFTKSHIAVRDSVPR